MPTSRKNKPSVRLPGHVTPSYYKIFLHPDLEAHTFSGEVTITVAIDKAVTEITLHSVDLAIASADITFGKKTILAARISYNEKAETATFHFKEKIPKGSANLKIAFSGILKDNMRGFYKSRYIVDGEERVMATTQFEATDARRAIPSFDEPAQKAVFEVNLVTPLDKTAISNTLPVEVREHSAGFKVVSFAPTPRMSTYLLAFIIGDFESVEKKSSGGVLVRVLCVPGKKHQAKFALDVTVRCLEFYEDYFDIPYPLDTLDMIAIPDFASLAMENWGAITFREIGLLVDEENTSTSTRELVAEVIAHELAHQWFGNLVTMEWWTHLWLNEGFASYVPYLAMDHLFPEWNMWEKFATDTLAGALKLDALRHTHPIEVEVHHPNEIGEIFDQVSYQKGASVIRMLAEYLGPKAFRDGLRHYLKKHSYRNASTIHLWESFEKISKKPVKKMMAVWTGTSGYPMLTAEEKGGKLALAQKRFYSSSASSKKSTDKTVWPIPLIAATPAGEKPLSLMTTKKLALPKPKGAWLKLNSREGAIYRVHYSPEMLDALREPVSGKILSATDRLGLIKDLFSLAEAGECGTTEALSFLSLYKNETEYIVWAEIISGLRYLANLMYGDKSYGQLRAYARSIIAGAVDIVGWDERSGESHDMSLMRPLVLGAAAYFGDSRVIDEALRKFSRREKHAVHADLRGVIYAVVAREGGEAEYETLLRMYRAETLHEEKNRILGALGLFSQRKLLARTLDFTMSEEVRMQDRNGAFASVLINPHGRALAWSYIKKNWKKIGHAYGEGNHLLSRLIGVLNRHTTREAYADIKAFFKAHTAPAAERTIDQTLEHIDSNVRWLARDGKRIAAWLAKNVPVVS